MKTRVLYITLLANIIFVSHLLGQSVIRQSWQPAEGPANYTPGFYRYYEDAVTSRIEDPNCSLPKQTNVVFFVDFASLFSPQGCTQEYEGIVGPVLLNSNGSIEVLSVQTILTVAGSGRMQHGPDLWDVFKRLKITLRYNGPTSPSSSLKISILYKSRGNGFFCENDRYLDLYTNARFGKIEQSDFTLTRTQGTGVSNCGVIEKYTLNNLLNGLSYGPDLTVTPSISPAVTGLSATTVSTIGNVKTIEVLNTGAPISSYNLSLQISDNRPCNAQVVSISLPFTTTRNLPGKATVSGISSICATVPGSVTFTASATNSGSATLSTSRWQVTKNGVALPEVINNGLRYFLDLEADGQPASYTLKAQINNGCGWGAYSNIKTFNLVTEGPNCLGEALEVGDLTEDQPVLTTEDPQTLVYPNPASTELNVVVPEYIQVPATIQLVSPQGAIVVSKQTQTRSNKLDVSTYPEGLYLVQVTDGNQVVSAKAFIKR